MKWEQKLAQFIFGATNGHRKSGGGGGDQTPSAPATPETGRTGTEPPAARSSIVAWRFWKIADDKLTSCCHNVTWEGPVLRADAVPTEENENGVYAVKDLNGYGSYYSEGGAWGEVELSGTVVVGSRGYRGEVATVRSLFLQKRDWVCVDERTRTFDSFPTAELINALEQRYAVEVGVLDAPPGYSEYQIQQAYYAHAQQQMGNPFQQTYMSVSSRI